jgi:hypothetical protein
LSARSVSLISIDHTYFSDKKQVQILARDQGREPAAIHVMASAVYNNREFAMDGKFSVIH